MFKLNLDQSGRILSATYAHLPTQGTVTVPELPTGNLYDYRYVNGAFVYDPLPPSDIPEEAPAAPQEDPSVWDDLAAAIREGVNSV